MNNAITSREEILKVGREIVLEAGLQALNIRDVARKSGVAVGTIYNYFPTKSDLVVATVESVWKEMMRGFAMVEQPLGFVTVVESLFQSIRQGSQQVSSFFIAHSMSWTSVDKEKGRETMEKTFSHMKKGLLLALKNDSHVKPAVFSVDFSPEEFIDFVFANLMSLLMSGATSCDYLLQVIRRIIY